MSSDTPTPGELWTADVNAVTAAGARPPARRPTTSSATAAAVCLSCGWTTSGPGALGNAARHHDATGHVVNARLERQITYGDHGAPADQTDLLTALEELDR